VKIAADGGTLHSPPTPPAEQAQCDRNRNAVASPIGVPLLAPARPVPQTHPMGPREIRNDGWIAFPLWLERSGLPAHLNDVCKSPHAWAVFRKIVELDIARNPDAPGTVEIGIAALGALVGLDAARTRQALTKMRKSGALRSFLPDNDEEEALFQPIAPMPTPVSCDALRASDRDLANATDAAFRYATAAPEAPPPDAKPEDHDPKLREVVNLYLDNVSMKLNAFVLDELRLISGRFDLALVRKVFLRAKAKEVQTLGWILKDIRREHDTKEKAAKAEREARGA